MAGHSHWANIARKKARIDKVRGKLFAKLSRAIIVAAQHGGGDPSANLTLRYAIDKARKNSMPMDNIERAVKKGCGDTTGARYEELLYEGYGPDGVAVLCEILTENRNRTASEVRKIFEVHGGNLGATGCVAWMFDRKAVFAVGASEADEDTLFEVALEAGADNVESVHGGFQVTGPPESFQAITDALEAASIETQSAEIVRVPQNTIELEVKSGRRVIKLLDVLEENDDIQNVTANFSIPDEIMNEVMAG
ncbi:MAG: YebC/PmpR family DNA-binding transcriptional regulator [Fuerstiella sp.]|jgi:YebC/PmpR family DNA-binding regulatory protein|nr:YebC/PmpR family DNA-binding transcriptional regulator [Fuerstiella sp.]MDG2128772.1 YebC/PmpR family DNA-binding transcriptional regulator [Fuerstiella sp.]